MKITFCRDTYQTKEEAYEAAYKLAEEVTTEKDDVRLEVASIFKVWSAKVICK